MLSVRITAACMFIAVLVFTATGCGERPAAKEKPAESAIHSGPAPILIEISVKPEHESYRAGEKVIFKAALKNVSKTPQRINNEPKLRIGKFGAAREQMDELSIPGWSKVTLEPDQSIEAALEWKQHGKSGHYEVEFGDIKLDSSTLSGAGSRFNVTDQSERPRVETIDAGRQLVLPSEAYSQAERSVLTVKQIEMNEDKTSIRFEIATGQPSPLGFDMLLERSGARAAAEPEYALGLEQSEAKEGVITGKATFEATMLEETKLKLIIRNWNVVHIGESTETFEGPWSIELPL